MSVSDLPPIDLALSLQELKVYGIKIREEICYSKPILKCFIPSKLIEEHIFFNYFSLYD